MLFLFYERFELPLTVHRPAIGLLLLEFGALVPAPAGISPTSAAEQKHNQKNDQYGFHLDPPQLEEGG
jgi:hypothetical protein